MTAIGNINAGSRITASEIRGVAPLAAYKASAQSVTSSTTLVNDNDLILSISANGVYVIQGYLAVSGGSGAFKYTWSTPSGSSGTYGISQYSTAGTYQNINEAWSTTVTGQSPSSGANAIWFYGVLVNSSTTANMQLQWAQNSSNATATVVNAYSYVTAWQIQ